MGADKTNRAKLVSNESLEWITTPSKPESAISPPLKVGGSRVLPAAIEGNFAMRAKDFDGFQYFPDLGSQEFVELGREVRVFVRFMQDRWEQFHQPRLHVGMRFQIREGDRAVGEGVVTRLDVPAQEADKFTE